MTDITISTIEYKFALFNNRHHWCSCHQVHIQSLEHTRILDIVSLDLRI